MIPKVKILNYALFTGFWLLCWSCQNEQCKLYDAVFADLPSPVDADWLVQEEADTADVNNESRLIAKFELKNGGTTHFVNLGETGGAPQIGLITVNSKISRGRSPQSTLMSPMEIFLSLADEGVSTPALLVRHHQSLARLARFDSIPRMFTSPPWSGGGPDLPPEYGEQSICAESNFGANWAWFSMGHGVNNQHTNVPFEMWTGWSVLTGSPSEARSVLICLPHQENVNGPDPQARFIISNQEGNGAWVNIFDSGFLSLGEGVGFQTYGPGNGRTRIRIIILPSPALLSILPAFLPSWRPF